MVRSDSTSNEESETEVSGFDIGFGSRLKWIVEKIGTRKKAGRIVGVKPEMITKYIDGRAKPSFFAVRALAYEAGESLDWIASGRPETSQPSSETFDEELLSMVIEELERFREERNLYWSPQQKARLTTLGYDMMLEKREKGEDTDTDSLQYILKAAS